MSPKEHAQLAKAYLDGICDKIDAHQPVPRLGRNWWRIVAPTSVAVGLSLTGACGGTTDEPGPAGKVDAGQDALESGADVTSEPDVMQAEVCDDGVDNDGDGQIDCGDLDCMGIYPCMGFEYAAPF